MKKVLVLGGGCNKCHVLAEQVSQVAKSMGITIELEKVTDFKQIMNYGVMATPALIIDGQLVSSGRVLSAAEIQEFLQK